MSIHPEVIAHIPVMQRYALKLKRNRDAAHDLVVDALFYFDGKDLSHVDHIKSYVNSFLRFANMGRKKALRTVSIEELRERVNTDEDSDMVDMLLSPTYPNQEYAFDLKRLHDKLPPILRTYYFEDLDIVDIAERDGVSRQNTHVKVNRERKRYGTAAKSIDGRGVPRK